MVLVAASQLLTDQLAPQGAADPLALILEMLRRKGEFVQLSLDYPRQGLLSGLLLLVIVVAGCFYGLPMGYPGGWKQSLASGCKTPLLYLLTLAVCFPALFVVQVILGSQLDLLQTLNILLFALAFNAVLLASFSPIAGFFGLTSSYHFMKLLHVILFTLCGWISMAVLYHGLSLVGGARVTIPLPGVRLFLLWVFIYGFAGTQMAWVLRPFLGEPALPFELFRRRGKGLNFYTAVLLSLAKLSPAGRSTFLAADRAPASPDPGSPLHSVP